MVSPAEQPPQRRRLPLRVSRSAIWLGLAIVATALLTAAALVFAGG